MCAFTPLNSCRHTVSNSLCCSLIDLCLIAYCVQAELLVMRKEYWESRTDGSPEMYVALRNVCEAILNNDNLLADAILEVTVDGELNTR